MRAPTGAHPKVVRRFGDAATGSDVVTGDHRITVPLDHDDPGGPTIEVVAREVRATARADQDQPYLLFLQGGPGGRAPRPGVDGPGWLTWALERYRVLLLDQRGTGASSSLDRHTLPRLGGPAAQAAYLAMFRADAVVADAEALRRHLCGDQPWSVLGQSFGGFCVWTYLGQAPHGLARAYVTGGIPPVGSSPDEVYRATTAAVARRTADLDAAHPRARAVLAEVAGHLEQVAEYLPTGERLTVCRLQEVGSALGGVGGTDRLAHLADDAWARPGERLSDTFLAGVAGLVSYAERPLYALLHEAIYAEGGTVTGWSAARVRGREGPPAEPVVDHDGVLRLPLTGEMVYPHTVANDPALAPLAEAAQALAERPWHEPLYHPGALAASQVPVAAQVYTQDMYVDAGLSRAVAATTGGVRVVEDGVRHHDGLRRDGAEVLAGLHALLGGDAAADGTDPSPRGLAAVR